MNLTETKRESKKKICNEFEFTSKMFFRSCVNKLNIFFPAVIAVVWDAQICMTMLTFYGNIIFYSDQIQYLHLSEGLL